MGPVGRALFVEKPTQRTTETEDNDELEERSEGD